MMLRAAMLMTGVAFAQTEPPAQTQSQPQPPVQPQTQPQVPAHPAPSFDCSHAASVVEKEICAISEFADLDARISTLYALAQTIVSARDAEALRADQRVWMRERDECGNRLRSYSSNHADIDACLHDELNRREAFLHVVVASKQFTKP